MFARVFGLHAAGPREETERRTADGFACAAGDEFGTDSETGAARTRNVAFPAGARTGSGGSDGCAFANDTAARLPLACAVHTFAEGAAGLTHANAIESKCAAAAAISVLIGIEFATVLLASRIDI